MPVGKDGMDAPNKVDRLIAESEATLKRLEKLSNNGGKDASLIRRAGFYARRNTNGLMNVVLSGTMFGLALMKMNDKHKYEEEIQVCESRIRLLESQLQGADMLADEAAAVISSKNKRASKERLQEALDNFRMVRQMDRGKGGAASGAASIKPIEKQIQAKNQNESSDSTPRIKPQMI